MRPFTNFDLLDLGELELEFLLRPKRMSRAQFRAAIAQQHREQIRLLLTELPKDPKHALPYAERVAKYGAETVRSLSEDPPSLVGLLVNRDVDSLGPDRPIDAGGRTALMFCCDPSAWRSLNKNQMERLHSLEVLEDLVYAAGSWQAKDHRGMCADDVCPEWLRECFAALEEQRDNARAFSWPRETENNDEESLEMEHE